MQPRVGDNEQESVDVVYTWVDDSFPGYLDLLGRYSGSSHDVNPNRTRDNLDILKYSLRSLTAYVPFVKHIYILSCAPQVPRWLAVGRPGLSVVHHDAVLEPSVLPTFNSFAIVSAISRIPGLSRRFFYIEDDMLFAGPVTLADFMDENGRLRLFPRPHATCAPKYRDSDDLSPWNTGLAYCNHLLDEAFGQARRRRVNHLPLLVDRDIWDEMLQRWQTDFARTRASRFRAKGNAVPEYLYPYFLYHTGRARMEPTSRTYRDIAYCSVDNVLALMRLRLWMLDLWRRKTLTLNDNFNAKPNPKVVALMSEYLSRTYPDKSPFEA